MTSPTVVTPPQRRALTPQEKTIYAFIRQWLSLRQSSPSLLDLVDQCNLRSTDSARKHCQTLARKGWITFDATVERGIALVEAQS